MLHLWGRLSSINVRKVLWLCAELGLEPALEAWGSGHRDTRVPEFLALNPNGHIPVIVDDRPHYLATEEPGEFRPILRAKT